MKTAALLAAAAAAPIAFAQPSSSTFEDNGRIIQGLRDAADGYQIKDISAAGARVAVLTESLDPGEEQAIIYVYQPDGPNGWAIDASPSLSVETSFGAAGPVTDIALGWDGPGLDTEYDLLAGQPLDDRVTRFSIPLFSGVNDEPCWIDNGTIPSPFAPGSEYGDAVDVTRANTRIFTLVGAPGEATMGANAGAAHFASISISTSASIFDEHEFYPTGGAGERFGETVSIHRVPGILADDEIEWYVAIGAPGADGGNGAVYIYTRLDDSAANFILAARIANPNSAITTNFGESIAITKDYLIVGAPQTNGTRGGFYAFERNTGGAWISAGATTSSTSIPIGARLGTSVDAATVEVDGVEYITYAVGAPGWPTGGRTQVFIRDSFNVFLGNMFPTDPDATNIQRHGFSVAIPEGNAALVYSAATIYDLDTDQRDGAIFQADLAKLELPTLNDVAVNEGETAEFTISPSGGSSPFFSPSDATWTVNDAPISLAGVVTQNLETLTIDPTFAALDGATIQYTVSDNYGRSKSSNQATLTVLTPDTADINKDGTVDVFDLIDFLQAFSAALN